LSMGTLRSSRISTRLPERSRSVMRMMVMGLSSLQSGGGKTAGATGADDPMRTGAGHRTGAPAAMAAHHDARRPSKGGRNGDGPSRPGRNRLAASHKGMRHCLGSGAGAHCPGWPAMPQTASAPAARIGACRPAA
jgi:hypothetical protein